MNKAPIIPIILFVCISILFTSYLNQILDREIRFNVINVPIAVSEEII